MRETKTTLTLTDVLQETAVHVMPDEATCQQIFCSVMQAMGVTISESLSSLCDAKASVAEMACF